MVWLGRTCRVCGAKLVHFHFDNVCEDRCVVRHRQPVRRVPQRARKNPGNSNKGKKTTRNNSPRKYYNKGE